MGQLDVEKGSHGISGEMDIEFHYYMTHLIALRAGFKPDDAFVIACASQHTDENDEAHRIEGGFTERLYRARIHARKLK
jgi:predicted GNAT family acetyltransferase